MPIDEQDDKRAEILTEIRVRQIELDGHRSQMRQLMRDVIDHM